MSIPKKKKVGSKWVKKMVKQYGLKPTKTAKISANPFDKDEEKPKDEPSDMDTERPDD